MKRLQQPLSLSKYLLGIISSLRENEKQMRDAIFEAIPHKGDCFFALSRKALLLIAMTLNTSKPRMRLLKPAFLLLFLLAALLNVSGQTVTTLEYFFDNDPGFGNGTPVTITQGSVINKTFAADLTGLSTGIHIFYARVKDSNGNWSFSYNKPLLIQTTPAVTPAAQNVTALEYFFDNDPGFGNGTPVTITQGSAINKTFAADLTGLSTGIHIFYARVKDNLGNWSFSYNKPILIQTAPMVTPAAQNVTTLEYFFDNDPGFGNGTPVTITQGSAINKTFAADLTGLSTGIHIFYARVKDNLGNWSFSYNKPILIQTAPVITPAAQNITALEYFVDTDPGFGNGTPLAITQGAVIDENLVIGFCDVSLPAGTHTLYIRAKDNNGNWSFTYNEKFESVPVTCDDADLCTTDSCANGICIFTPLDCEEGDLCTVDACNAGICSHTPVICNDNDACTTNGCIPATGCAFTTITCNDNDACTTNSCVPATGCVYTPIVCNDNDACTSNSCAPASGCVYTPIVCNDNDACTANGCIPATGCAYTPIVCNDNDACTSNSCAPASGCVYTPIVCNDNDACTANSCVPATGCEFTPIVCNDNDACTSDNCALVSGCVFTPIVCEDNDACTANSCIPATGCAFTPINCTSDISGNIISELGAAVPLVTVNVTGTSAQSQTTPTSGAYIFSADQGGDYTITPSKNNDAMKSNGISTLDITLIRRHVLGITLLDSPYKIIAADVNSSNSVTTLDIPILRRLILGIDTSFNGKLWTFVPQDFVFANPQVPFPYDKFKSYTNLSANQINQNFIGIKLGDVDNTWDPGTLKKGAVGEVQFAMNEYQTLPGDEIIIPVRVKDFNDIAGYQFTMTWNPEVILLLEVVNQSILAYYGEQSISEGMLTTSWNDGAGASVTLDDDAVAFELKFKVIGALGSATEIKIGSEITASEAYTDALDLLDITATHGSVKVGEVISSLTSPPSSLNIQLSVQPNPFSNFTNIIFTILQDEQVNIVIYDLMGKEVQRFEGHYQMGEHKIEWAGDDAHGMPISTGLYHVRMIAGNEMRSVKVAVVR